ncbi:MAG: hypothetical protein ACLSBD_08295 [Blautia massiliensis (ex Durand et al. 2017)]
MEESRKLSGKDLITIGIFSAIYFYAQSSSYVYWICASVVAAVTGRDRNCDRNPIPAYDS